MELIMIGKQITYIEKTKKYEKLNIKKKYFKFIFQNILHRNKQKFMNHHKVKNIKVMKSK